MKRNQRVQRILKGKRITLNKEACKYLGIADEDYVVLTLSRDRLNKMPTVEIRKAMIK